MKSLPVTVAPFRCTPEFTEATVPNGLLHRHTTQPGVWALITVLEGALTYRILEPHVEEHTLSPGHQGVVEPTVPHEVVPAAGVRFQVEFYREPVAG